jgi:two-component system repressor protein LuxO
MDVKEMTETVKTELKTILTVGSRETDTFSLRTHELFEGWSVISAETGELGIALLNEDSVRLIISENILPDMDGIAFLKKAGNIRPEAVCCLITAGAGREIMAKAFREGISMFFEG